MNPLISVRDLRVSFRLSKTEIAEAVRGVSFDVPANSTVALVGESGSGKSVSAMSLVRLLPENAIVSPQSKVLYNGLDLLSAPIEHMRRLRGKDISVVFQEPMSSLNPVFMVGDQIAEVLRIHLGLNARQALDRALELMTEFAQFNPYLNGSVLNGTAGQFADIQLQLFAEPHKAVELDLLNKGIHFETGAVRLYAGDMPIDAAVLSFERDAVTVRLTLLTPRELRSRIKTSAMGRPIERANRAAVETLLAQD